MRYLLNAILDLVYPRECIGCGVRLTDGSGACLCRSCLASAGRFSATEQCPRCGGQIGPHARGPRACQRCGENPAIAFEKGTAVFHYEGVAREAVHSLKFSRDLSPVGWMGRELSEKLRQTAWFEEVDVIVPVPLHWRRRLARRFNQSELIARRIARAHGKPLLTSALRRIRNTEPQSMLAAERRKENVRGAFRVARRKLVAARKVLLVDDVMATCSTASECARTLKKAGAGKVYVAVFAR